MTSVAKVGLAGTDKHRLAALRRPSSAMSSANEGQQYWRGVSHSSIPELLHGAYTQKILAANIGLPSIADHCLVTSLASIMPSAARDNPRPNATSHLCASDAEQCHKQEECAGGNGMKPDVASSNSPTIAPKNQKSKSLFVKSSKKVAMIAEIRNKMVENILADESKKDQLLQCQAKIQTLQDHIKSLNVLLAARETSAAISCAAVNSDSNQQTQSSASEKSCAPNSSDVHTALVMRMDQLESSRDELKRQLTTFQHFAPVYKEVLTIMGVSESKQTAAQTVQSIEHLFEDRRISNQRILELQEKLEAVETELKTVMREKNLDLAGKESEINTLKNELEQQRGLTSQMRRQKDEAIERKMHLESAMLQLKISLKMLAESWGCSTDLVVEAETLVALLSQTIIGKSSAQETLQAVQGVINTTWLEILHTRHPEKKLPGDIITGIRMIYDSMKALNQQNVQLVKNLKDAKHQVAETREELEKWRRLRGSVRPSQP
jgi:hypothetical protein